jgi:hypothetical protein
MIPHFSFREYDRLASLASANQDTKDVTLNKLYQHQYQHHCIAAFEHAVMQASQYQNPTLPSTLHEGEAIDQIREREIKESSIEAEEAERRRAKKA